jgi:hypothetical protein
MAAVVQLKSNPHSEERQILSPFDKTECLSLKEAADIAGKSESTMRNWCGVHGLNRRIGGGTWAVSKVALAMFLDGDFAALRAYHAGDRTTPPNLFSISGERRAQCLRDVRNEGEPKQPHERSCINAVQLRCFVRQATRGLCTDLLLNLAYPSSPCRLMLFLIFTVGVVAFPVRVISSAGDAPTFGSTIASGLTRLLSGASSTCAAFNPSDFGDGTKRTFLATVRPCAASSSFTGIPKLVFNAKRPPIQIRQPNPSQTVLNITPHPRNLTR